MIIKTVAVELLSSEIFVRHNLPVCKVLGSHSIVVVDWSLFRCGAVLQGIGIVMWCCVAGHWHCNVVLCCRALAL